MWTFSSVARIEERFNRWYALLVLTDSGRDEAFFINFDTKPTQQQATTAGETLVSNKNEHYAQEEFDNIVFNGSTFSLKYQTSQQFASRFRSIYQESTSLKCAKMATWIIDSINSGLFTDIQVRNAFGLTVGQYTTLKDKMIALHDKYVAILEARGE